MLITVKGEVKRRVFFRSMLHYYTKRRITWLWRTIGVVCILFGLLKIADSGVFGLFVISYSGKKFFNLFPVAYGIFVFLIARLNASLVVRRVFSTPNLITWAEYSFCDENLCCKSNLGEATTEWRFFRFWMETSEAFLLVSHSSTILVIERAGFICDEDITEFRTWLQSTLKRR